jgi:hypothetical protein
MFTHCLDPVFPFLHRSFGMYKKNGCFVLMHVQIFIKLYIYKKIIRLMLELLDSEYSTRTQSMV